MRYLEDKYEAQLLEELDNLNKFAFDLRIDNTNNFRRTHVRKIAMQSQLVHVLAENLWRELGEDEAAYAE